VRRQWGEPSDFQVFNKFGKVDVGEAVVQVAVELMLDAILDPIISADHFTELIDKIFQKAGDGHAYYSFRAVFIVCRAAIVNGSHASTGMTDPKIRCEAKGFEVGIQHLAVHKGTEGPSPGQW